MTSKLSSLTTVHQVAKHKEDEKATVLKLAQDEHAKHQKYLNDLESYRLSYCELSNQKGATGVSAAMFRHYQSFLQSIDQGILQQQGAVAQMSNDLREKRDHWQAAHQYSKAINGLIDKHLVEQERLEAKREQSVVDELNLRNYVLNQRQVLEEK